MKDADEAERKRLQKLNIGCKEWARLEPEDEGYDEQPELTKAL